MNVISNTRLKMMVRPDGAVCKSYAALVLCISLYSVACGINEGSANTILDSLSNGREAKCLKYNVQCVGLQLWHLSRYIYQISEY